MLKYNLYFDFKINLLINFHFANLNKFGIISQ